MFRWAVGEELIRDDIMPGLDAVEGLKGGAAPTPERTGPVRPVEDHLVDAVEGHVALWVWAMIQVQQLTGMRPGERVCTMTTRAIDRSRDVWVYSPAAHKTSFQGKARLVADRPEGTGRPRPLAQGRTRTPPPLQPPRGGRGPADGKQRGGPQDADDAVAEGEEAEAASGPRPGRRALHDSDLSSRRPPRLQEGRDRAVASAPPAAHSAGTLLRKLFDLDTSSGRPRPLVARDDGDLQQAGHHQGDRGDEADPAEAP